MADVVCTSQLGHGEEEDHIRQALLRCNYPIQVLNRLQSKINTKLSTKQPYSQRNRPQLNNNTNTNNYIFLVVPYTKGLSESFKKVCNKVGVQVLFEGNNTICNLQVAPKDKDTITQKVG